MLHTAEEIRAAGAAAVADFPALRDEQVDQVVALLEPVRDDVWKPLHDSERHAADAA